MRCHLSLSALGLYEHDHHQRGSAPPPSRALDLALNGHAGLSMALAAGRLVPGAIASERRMKMTDVPGEAPSDDGEAKQGGGDQEAPYVHDDAAAPKAAGLVDAAYGAAMRWWDIADHLRSQATDAGVEPEAPLVRELILAVSYRLRLNHGGEAACDLVPQTDTGDFAWPPRIAEVLPDVIALWRDVAGLAEHQAARAHFSDLLFERRDGNGRDRAVNAGTAYLATARSSQETDLDVAACLVRAWDLARKVSAWPLLSEVYAELVARSDAEMSGGTPRPGYVLPMIAAVAAKPTRAQQDRAPETIPDSATVDRLLEAAFTTFTADYLASQITSLMRARTSDPAEIEEINRREVPAHLTAAAATAGMARQFHLQHAIKTARSRGLPDLVRQATAELQQIPVKDLGLKRSSSSIRVPRDQVERFLEAFTVNPDWREGLGFFLRTSCPTGELEQLRQDARDIAKVAVLSSIIPRTILGKDGVPRWTAASEEDRQAEQVASLARIRAENQGRVLADGLNRMADRYGIPPEPDLAIFLSADGQMDQSLALSLARGFRHYWSGDYEACVHVIVPKIEAAARALLRELDEGIYRLQVAKDPGQYPGLYVLLQELEKLALDESWAYFLRWLLLGPPGQNIRNEIAHGFVGDVSPSYAALALRAAALLITITAPQPSTVIRSAGDEQDRPADLAELPERDRDDILAILNQPVEDPVPFPWREGLPGRLAGLTASALRATATTFRLVARRLDP
jgi:hypothetical protein